MHKRCKVEREVGYGRAAQCAQGEGSFQGTKHFRQARHLGNSAHSIHEAKIGNGTEAYEFVDVLCVVLLVAAFSLLPPLLSLLLLPSPSSLLAVAADAVVGCEMS